MGLFARKKVAAPSTSVHATGDTANKKIVLNFRGGAQTVQAVAAATLEAGGYTEPSPREPEIGDNAVPGIGAVMPDGTVYAGISPDTGRPMYSMAADAPLPRTFNLAAAYAAQLNTEKYLGHNDWRVPTKDELNVLFNNRARIGGFNLSGSYPEGWYWSASSYYELYASDQRFSDGCQLNHHKDNHSAVRCIR